MKEKHKLFADLYLSNGNNATKAYIDAGYSPNKAHTNASKLLLITTISEYIKEQQEKTQVKLSVTKEEIISKLSQVIDKFLLTGNLTGNALKAVDILNKMTGWYAPEKLDHTTNGKEIGPTEIKINIVKPNGD